MRLVVDASVAVEVCLAGGILGPLTGHELHAPALLASEVSSALHELAWRGEIPPDRGRTALGFFAEIPITLERAGSPPVLAWEAASQLGWAKTYDAEYVALAQSLRCPLVTLDARLHRGAARLVEMLAPGQL